MREDLREYAAQYGDRMWSKGELKANLPTPVPRKIRDSFNENIGLALELEGDEKAGVKGCASRAEIEDAFTFLDYSHQVDDYCKMLAVYVGSIGTKTKPRFRLRRAQKTDMPVWLDRGDAAIVLNRQYRAVELVLSDQVMSRSTKLRFAKCARVWNDMNSFPKPLTRKALAQLFERGIRKTELQLLLLEKIEVELLTRVLVQMYLNDAQQAGLSDPLTSPAGRDALTAVWHESRRAAQMVLERDVDPSVASIRDRLYSL